jgi:hypothetical protein
VTPNINKLKKVAHLYLTFLGCCQLKSTICKSFKGTISGNVGICRQGIGAENKSLSQLLEIKTTEIVLKFHLIYSLLFKHWCVFGI